MDERQKSNDPEVRQILKDKINKFYKENKNTVFPENDIHKKTNKLLIEYNKHLRDDENFPNKDEVRDWFYAESYKLIDEGALSHNFLYPEFIGPIEELEKIY